MFVFYLNTFKTIFVAGLKSLKLNYEKSDNSQITSPNHTTLHVPAVIHMPSIEKDCYIDYAMLYYIQVHCCYNNIKYIL